MTIEDQTTKEKILESALRLFSQKGYLGATTREIAKEAGIAEVTLFRHFPSKEKLLEGVLKNYSFLPELKHLIPEIYHLKYEDALFLIIRTFLKTLFLRKDISKIMKTEILMHPEKVTGFFQPFLDEFYDTIASYFLEMQKRGIIREFDARLAGRALLGMIFSYFEVEEFIYQRQSKIEDYEKPIKEFIDIFVRGTLK
jgi:AcrR family transcriptional regulator